MRRTPTTDRALAWWADRLSDQCKDDVRNGLFVDQLWMNYAPLFFSGVGVSDDPGLNMAYWNLHERRLERHDGKWMVNGHWLLVFYHFSSFEFDKPDSLGRHSTRYTMNDRPEMRPLFDEYRTELVAHEYRRYRSMSCAYAVQRAEWLARQKAAHYRANPHLRFVALLKAAVPRRVKRFIKAS
jgi:hypothetical protein